MHCSLMMDLGLEKDLSLTRLDINPKKGRACFCKHIPFSTSTPSLNIETEIVSSHIILVAARNDKKVSGVFTPERHAAVCSWHACGENGVVALLLSTINNSIAVGV